MDRNASRMETSRNFDLRLSGTLSAVSIEVIDSPAGQTAAPAVLACTVSPDALRGLQDNPNRSDLQAVGRSLWRCAFGAPAVAELWRASVAHIGPEGILRLRITIDAAELAALPWELLYDEALGRFLALDGQTPVARFTRLPIPSAPWPHDRSLRLLFTGSSPSDLLTLDVAGEWGGIEQALAPLVKQGQMEVPGPLPEGATLPSLLTALRRQVDIWHFAGHGTNSGLIFCKEHNKPHPVDAGELGQMLLGEGVRLAVINACRAGAGGGQAASVAGALLRAGIPSVVAMQANVSDATADAFAGAFYDAIAVGQGVDQAVTAARKAIWAAGTSEWWTPALFMRTPEGRIWRMPVKAETEARGRELAYLDGVIEKYKFWEEKYTPLSGINEVRAARTTGPLLDLPSWFVPAGIEMLEEHGFGSRRLKVPVDDLRKAVVKYRRLVILGEPGSGKTTTLWRLAYDYAVAAIRDEKAPLPLYVPLGAYSGPESPIDYAKGYYDELGPNLKIDLREGRIILLLDGLNEMPQSGYLERVRRIQAFIDQHPKVGIIVTCRALDYGEELNLFRLEVKPLEAKIQREYLHRYLGEVDGENLFIQMGGAMWMNRYYVPLDQLPPLLALGRNPYMLMMTAQIYAARGGTLPEDQGQLIAAFVDALLRREETRCDHASWPGTSPLRQAMAQLAHAMQRAGERGTAVNAGWAAQQLAVPGVTGDRIAYLCSSASLLEQTGSQVRFVHQLVQEYFAALSLVRIIQKGDSLRRYWHKDWTQPSGWEETFILLAGILSDTTSLIERLLPANPAMAARCIAEIGGKRPAESVVRSVQRRLLVIIEDQHAEVAQRDAADLALNNLGDPRPGVGLHRNGLPDIDWIHVPDVDPASKRREFFYGEANERRIEPDFWIGRYPITNLQFRVFLNAADGFSDAQWWEGLVKPQTEADSRGSLKAGASKLTETIVYEQRSKYGNHPREWVSWYDAIAFCRWLTAKSRKHQELLPRELDRSQNWEINLPTEWQWEKAARGHNGWKYPWGQRGYKSGYANIYETMPGYVVGKYFRGKTSTVGIYPHNNSPYGVADMSGNVWEWCLNEFDHPNKIDPDGYANRVLRGGSWADNYSDATASVRHLNPPNRRSDRIGFRLAVTGRVLFP